MANAVDPVVWRRVAEDLAARIRGGEFVAGQQLPGLHSLAAHYSVATGTLRKAISQLVDIGAVGTAKGAGTYVRAIPPADIWAPAEGEPAGPSNAELAEAVGRLTDELGEVRSRLDAHLRRHGGDLP